MKVEYLWRFEWDFRGGMVTSLFVATEEQIDALAGREVCFGEVLGKHSEVSGTIERSEITKVDLSPLIVSEVTSVLGKTWSGYNPMEHVRTECVRCESYYTNDEIWTVEGQQVCGYCITDDEYDAQK